MFCFVFFSECLTKLFTDAGYDVINCHYVQRRTVNKKEGIDVPRIFVQGKFVKKIDMPTTEVAEKGNQKSSFNACS